jgi:hypothetical protein
MWKEMVVARFVVSPGICLEELKKATKILQVGQLVSKLRFEPWTSKT